MSPRYDVEVVDVGGILGDAGLFAAVVINGQSAGAVWRPDSSAARPWHAELRTPVISPLGAVSVERSRHETKRAAVAWVVVKALGGQWRARDFVDDVGEESWGALEEHLPLVPRWVQSEAEPCQARRPPSRPDDDPYLPCNRPRGHGGRHALYGLTYVLAVWHQAPEEPAPETTGASR